MRIALDQLDRWDIAVGACFNHMIKKNHIKALESRKKPHVHDQYLWGSSTNMIPTEKETSLGVNNTEGF